MDLTQLRKGIDEIDDRILELLNRRASLALEVGKTKDKSSADHYVPSRELDIFTRLEGANSGPFPTEAIRKVYREIISASLSLEKRLKVAFLGPQATFTHMAAMQQFGLSAELLPQRGIASVFDEVAKGNADYGVVPVENSNEGVVSHTLDMFMESKLVINAEILLEISHDLLSLSGSMDRVRKVISHPQALGQCRQWLEEHLPDVPLVDVASTALAAKMVADDPDAAAIANERAAAMYGLRMIARKIEDNRDNFTRFLVIGRRLPKASADDKTSIMFNVKDEPGILYRMLEPFSKRGVNLSKIESRPLKKKAWEYIFFLDVEGHIDQPHVHDAVEELKGYCQFIKVLGSYPKAR